jgi:hypothetical protein
VTSVSDCHHGGFLSFFPPTSIYTPRTHKSTHQQPGARSQIRNFSKSRVASEIIIIIWDFFFSLLFIYFSFKKKKEEIIHTPVCIFLYDARTILHFFKLNFLELNCNFALDGDCARF